MTNTFKSYKSYYHFVSSIYSKLRFVQTKETQNFLNVLIDTSKDYLTELKEGEILFRAQKGYDEIEKEGQIIYLPYKAERMLPKANKVKNGRVNPIGITVLYASDSEKTAVSETRPWIKEGISITRLRINRTLKIIDFSKVQRVNKIYFKEPKDPEVILQQVWSDVCNAFTKPVSIEDKDIEYIPTQVIGEYFKINGIDGIKYKSLLSDGNNYALFDITCAEMMTGIVLEIDNIDITTKQYGNQVNYYNGGNSIEYIYISEFLPPDDLKDNK